MRKIDAGHVSGCLIHHPAFITAILDTFQRLLETHHIADVAGAQNCEENDEYKNISKAIANLPQFNRKLPGDGSPIRNLFKAIYAIATWYLHLFIFIYIIY